jgi:hypothetical protein
MSTVPVEQHFGYSQGKKTGWHGGLVPPGQARVHDLAGGYAAQTAPDSGGGVVNAVPMNPSPIPPVNLQSGGGGSKLSNLFKDKKTLAIVGIVVLLLILGLYFFVLKKGKRGRKKRR